MAYGLANPGQEMPLLMAYIPALIAAALGVSFVFLLAWSLPDLTEEQQPQFAEASAPQFPPPQQTNNPYQPPLS